MTISLKHKFQSAKSDVGDTSLVRPSNWNDEHDLTMAADRLLGRTTAGTGTAEEISVGTGLTLSSGTLSVTTNTYQPLDTELTALAGLASAADTAPYFTGSGTAALMTVTAAGRNLLDDANAAAQLVTLGAAASGANTDITSVYLNNGGLKIKDTNASHGLTIAPGSDLTADRTLTVTTGDAARTLTISGNATVSQDYSTTGNPQFATIELGHASDTTLSRSAAGVLAVEGNLVPSPASQAHGDVLYRGASGWERLAAGTSGLFLQTAGAGAAPVWAAGSVPTVTTYTSGSGTHNLPSSGSYVLIRAWGAGGSGARDTRTGSSYSIGGGGGGGYKEAFFRFSDLPSSFSYSVGAGGTAVSSGTTTAGNAGGNTTVHTLTAYGGAGGTTASGTAASGGGLFSTAATGKPASNQWDGGVGGSALASPGSGSNGGDSYYGGGGGAGSTRGFGTYTAGTSVFGGTGGANNDVASGTAGSGTAPGGGGGGKTNTGGTSGAGANGRVEIWVW